MKRSDRVKTAISGLDEMLCGGLNKGSVCVVKGPPGSGKSTLGIEFIARGILEFDQPGLIVTFEYFPAELYRNAATIGFDFKRMENEGKLRTIFTTPEVFMEQMRTSGGLLDQIVSESHIERIFIDSISMLDQIEAGDERAMRELAYTFTSGLRRHNLTAVVTQEETDVMGSVSPAQFGFAFMADTIIQLRFVEIGSEIHKALVVLKMRASDHDKSIRRLEITGAGAKVGAPFEGAEDLLSGTPRRVGLSREAGSL